MKHFELLDAKNRVISKLFFDAKELVVLCDTVRAAHRAGFDLSTVGRDGEIRDGAVLGFTRTVTED